ncbi:hypothetical protein AMEX_G25717 [Astyanax mexicanus]|uniref:Ig-like domain-containing protein n=1 Tax=Astyanax mexicanus TaxID=7994 RepID=A0A8T2KRW4_ASTMX|nr:hypothetical protein AMEX_G25717 [Astyanax mexicanus]
MILITLSAVILIFSGEVWGQYRQRLTCPYSSDQSTWTRVWCKRDEVRKHCCTGFTFSTGSHQAADGSLSVQDGGKEFVVSVGSLPLGDGVYWCGVQNQTGIIIKLAESQLYTTPLGFIWDVLRWVLFLLLLLTVTGTSLYSHQKQGKEKVGSYFLTF